MPRRQKIREVEREDLRRKRELAKTGMVASMGSVLLTGMLKKKKAHIVSGVAFMGFAYWHTTLYAHSPNKKRFIEPNDAVSVRNERKTEES
jgi:hypothetical protein